CFFFQAEDGIRDRNVTGVQTCALPIYEPQDDQRDDARHRRQRVADHKLRQAGGFVPPAAVHLTASSIGKHVMTPQVEASLDGERSEERRVGKEGRCRGWRMAWMGKRSW